MNSQPKTLLLNRNFMLLVTGAWISQAGSQVALVTTSYWLKRSTNSPALVGLLATISALPVLFLSPLAGAVADRWSQRNNLLFWDVSSGIVSWSFVFLIGSHILPLNQVLLGIFAGNLVLATAGAFATPACNAFLPMLVDSDHLGKAIALTQSAGLISIVIGQALAGLLLARVEPHMLFGVDGTSYLISAAALFFIRFSLAAEAPPKPGRARNVWAEIQEGLTYIWHNRGLRTLILALFPLNLFTAPVLVFLPFYTTNNLHEPLSRYGYLVSMISAGMLAGFATGGRLKPQNPHVHKQLFGCITANAILTFALSVTHLFWLAMILLFLSGVMAGLMLILAVNSLMANTVPDKRGRVSSIFVMVTQGLTPLAMFVVGLFGGWLRGNIQLLYAGLSFLLLMTAAILYRNADLRRFFGAKRTEPQ